MLGTLCLADHPLNRKAEGKGDDIVPWKEEIWDYASVDGRPASVCGPYADKVNGQLALLHKSIPRL